MRSNIIKAEFVRFDPPAVNPAEQLYHHIQQLTRPEIVLIDDLPFIIAPASPEDVERFKAKRGAQP